MIKLLKGKVTRGPIGFRLVGLAVALCFAVCEASAQPRKAAQLDVESLVGADPADIVNTDNTHRESPNVSDESRKHTFLLMNVGTQKFFYIGGAYGRHASLKDYGMFLWIFNNSTTAGTYNIRTRQNYDAGNNQSAGNKDNKDSYVQFIDNDALKKGVYLDCQPTDASRAFGWKFEKAEDYNETTNKVYRISTYGSRYLTAEPDDKDGNLCEAVAEAPANSSYQIWKLITLAEYYKLFNESPSDLSAPIDATFLISNPGFEYNRTNNSGWLFSGSKGDTYNIRLGVDECYKYLQETEYKNGNNCYDNSYIYENGKYFCADVKNVHNGSILQSVPISKPGWYIVRCNGFTNKNGLASLVAIDAITHYEYNQWFGTSKKKSTSPLNVLEADGPKDMLAAGKAFHDGKYENEVVIHFTQAYLDSVGYSTSIFFGIQLEGGSATPSNEWTAFDNFRLLYAGNSDSPQLVLDEDNIDLRYLTETVDEYKNTVLHLKRSFTLNAWNTLILPVDLTWGQMKDAFGDDVKLAQLKEITENSVRFITVECDNDNETMLTAYTPYIIKPTRKAGSNPEYTTPRLKKATNQYWLDENEGIKNNEDGETRYTSGCVSVTAGHYDIPSVTLDRNLLSSKLNSHWVSTTQGSETSGSLVCKGTLAKTYYVKDDGTGYFYTDDSEQRDNLAGDYFMKDGKMWKVPTDKKYGLKAFRCWFELTEKTDSNLSSAAPSTDVALCIDGIQDNTTAIEDITSDAAFFHPHAVSREGIYNLNGQLISRGQSLDALPKGIYIVNGRMIRK